MFMMTDFKFSIAFVIPQAYRQQYGHVVRRELFWTTQELPTTSCRVSLT